VTYDDNYLALSFTPSAAITAAIPAGACVVTDSATYTLLAGRFDPAGPGCPAIVDPFGMFLAEDHDAPPPGKAPIPASFTSLWKKAFERAQSVVLTVQFSDYIPWTSSLVSWFDANYKLISAQPHAYVYTRRTSSLPRAATSSDSSFSNDLAAGLAALRGHDLSAARVDFAQAASRDPKSPIGEFDLGVVYGDLGDPQRAARAYEAALDVAPRYVLALYNLAVMLTASDPKRAIVLYQKIVGIQPSDADALFNLGLLLVSSGQQDLGRSDVRAAVALDPLLAKRIPPSIRLSSTG
jgi:tetratricopeptide (TPR) repeat protein